MIKFILKTEDSNLATDPLYLDKAISVLQRHDEEVFHWKTDYGHLVVLGSVNKKVDGEKTIFYLGNYSKENTDGYLIIFHDGLKEIIVSTDPNFRHIGYHAQIGTQIVVASEMKAILAFDDFVLDPNGIYSYIALGNFYGDVSLFRGIKPLMAGTTYLMAKDYLVVRDKFLYPPKYVTMTGTDYDGLVEIHAYIFKRVVQHYVDENKILETTLFLSGGLDSRMILMANKRFNAHPKFDMKTITIGDQIDWKYAKQVVESVNNHIIHYNFIPKPSDVIEFAPHQAYITEGASALGTCMLTPSSRLLEGVFMTGLPGDLNYGGSYCGKFGIPNKRIKFTKIGELLGKSSIKVRVFKRLLPHGIEMNVLDNIFSLLAESWLSLDGIQDHGLRTELFALNNRVRRGSVTTVGDEFGMRFPFMDNQILLPTLIIPPEIRKGRKFQKDVMEVINSEMTNLPCTSPTYADKKAVFNWKKLIAKIPLIRILGRKYIYRKMARVKETTYVPMATWLREDMEFREFILEHLKSFTKRGYLDPRAVSKLVEDHLDFKQNHMVMIANIVNLELVISQLGF